MKFLYYFICLSSAAWVAKCDTTVLANTNVNSKFVASITGAVERVICDYFARRTSLFHITYSNGVETSLLTQIFLRINCDIAINLERIDILDSEAMKLRFYNVLLANNYADFR